MKRGTTHIDWAISLVIFFLFVIFAFLYARPLYQNVGSMDALAELVADKFSKNTSIFVEDASIYVYANSTYDNAPVIIDYPYELNTSLIYLEGKEVAKDETRLMFIGNLQQGVTTFSLLKSEDPYPLSEQATDLVATETFASTNEFLAHFKDGLLEDMYFRTFALVFPPSYYVEKVRQENFSGGFNSSHIHARYRIENPSLQVEQYVFSSNTGIITFFTPKQVIEGSPKRYEIFFRIRNFSRYYDNAVENDVVDYTFNSCKEIYDLADITFHDPQYQALTFAFFPAVTKMKFCGETSAINITLEMHTDEPFQYRMIGHEGDYHNATKYQENHKATVGYFLPREGISEALLENFSSIAYRQRKKEWKFPESRNFQIQFYNDTTKFYAYEPVVPTRQNDVYTKTTFVPIINSYGNISYAKMYVRVW